MDNNFKDRILQSFLDNLFKTVSDQDKSVCTCTAKAAMDFLVDNLKEVTVQTTIKTDENLDKNYLQNIINESLVNKFMSLDTHLFNEFENLTQTIVPEGNTINAKLSLVYFRHLSWENRAP